MAETPTHSEVVNEAAHIEKYVPTEVEMLEFVTRALADVKRYLRNNRGINWSQVYDSASGDYFEDTDGNANNKDQLLKAIRLSTVSIIYKDNAQESQDSIWWDMYKEYRAEAEILLDNAKLDVDSNDDGEISDGEENATRQKFFGR